MAQVVGTGRPVAEAPQTWRPGWPFLLLLPFCVPAWVGGTSWAPWPWRSALLVLVAWYVGWWVLMAVNGTRWRVTFDGELVEAGGSVGRWRFRPEDVGSVIVPTLAPTAVVRLDRVERSVLGVRVPWPFPWRRALTPYVRPEWFVEVAGVPTARVRPGGLRWVASRLVRRPMSPRG